MNRKGKFIVFEGLDGCGKTTYIELIEKRLGLDGKRCEVTFEPTKNEIGKLIRRWLSGEITLDNYTAAALFAADRLDHIMKPDGLLGLLNDSSYILCDRYYLSSFAYQSIDIDLDWVMRINSVSMDKLRPDCHIFLDITPETALERLNTRENLEIYEEYNKLKMIYESYRNVIDKLKDTENIIVIDGNRDITSVEDDIWNVIERI